MQGTKHTDVDDTFDKKLSDVSFKQQATIVHPTSLKFLKRSIDIAVALVFFCLLGWVYLILLLGVLISSGRPALYFQPRYGKNGSVFRFYKFRSMVQNSDEVLRHYLDANPSESAHWNKFQKLEKDPRVTKFGAFIRKTSLDELPQFWNVLIGDMSVIGPRPCMLEQKPLYGAHWSSYCAVRPGITGLWQVSGRNQLSYGDRVKLDVQYVQDLSLLTDLKIFVKTIKVVLTGHGSY